MQYIKQKCTNQKQKFINKKFNLLSNYEKNTSQLQRKFINIQDTIIGLEDFWKKSRLQYGVCPFVQDVTCVFEFQCHPSC